MQKYAEKNSKNYREPESGLSDKGVPVQVLWQAESSQKWTVHERFCGAKRQREVGVAAAASSSTPTATLESSGRRFRQSPFLSIGKIPGHDFKFILSKACCLPAPTTATLKTCPKCFNQSLLSIGKIPGHETVYIIHVHVALPASQQRYASTCLSVFNQSPFLSITKFQGTRLFILFM